MSLLGSLRLCLIRWRLFGHIFLAIPLQNNLAGFVLRFFCHIHAVGSHIGNQPDGAFLAANLDSLVEPLRQHHRLFCAKAKFAPGFLLQGAGGKGRCGVAAGVLARYLLHRIVGVLQVGHNCLCLLLIFNGKLVEFCPVALYQRGAEGLRSLVALLLPQIGFDGPVFNWLEPLNFALALDNEPHRHRLHPSRRQATPDLVPQERAEPIANQPVENAAGLLCVHQVAIYLAGPRDGRLNRVSGNLVKDHPMHRHGARNFESLGDVPGNRFAFTVRVGCEIDCVRLPQGLAKFGHNFLFGNFIFWCKIVFQIYCQSVFGKIADVPHAGQNAELFAEILLEGPGFGR